MNWADELIDEYKEGRRTLYSMRDSLGDTTIEKQDKTQVNGMISDMAFAIDWMETGRQPETHRGADIRGVYQFDDMEMLPDIYENLREEREELYIDHDKRQSLLKIFHLLSARERQCYIMFEAERMSMSQIGEKIGISKWTVRTHIDRARKKIGKVMSHDCRTNIA